MRERSLLDAVPVGIVVHDGRGLVVSANAAAEQLLGLTVDDMRDLPNRAPWWRTHRRDGTYVRLSEHAARVALSTGEPQRDQEIGITVRDGSEVWLQVQAVPFLDEGVVVGVVTSFVDITDRVGAEDRLRAGEQRLRLVLDAAQLGWWDWDLGTGALEWSANCERLFGLEPGTFGGTYDDFVATLHPGDVAFVERTLQDAIDAGGELDVEYRIVWPTGEERWIRAVGEAYRGADGAPGRFVGVAMDVTVRKRAELDREASERRLAFLARATSVLTASLDFEETSRRLVQLAVPFLADWCAVDVVEDDGSLRRVAIAHADPEDDHLARRLATPPLSSWQSGVPQVIRTGRPQLLSTLDDDELDRLANDDDRRALYGELGIHSLVIMPLRARNRTLGAIWFARSQTEESYDEVDGDLAQELARRAAMALDNARLYEERSRVARTLQASLLPPLLPEIPGVEVAARYRAAGPDNDIGGDFYDVFDTGGGTWTVVIGDVCGKGPEAAAVTGLARHTIRTAAMREDDPSRILAVLNEVILREGDDDERFCTAACGRLDVDGAGSRVRLTLACGGHPLPLLVRADGAVQPVGTPGTLLGVLPVANLSDQRVDLEPGDAVVLCTDGVVEAAGAEGFYGTDRLIRRLESLAASGADADGIAAGLESDVLAFQADQPRDDLAILVLRVRPA